ncbi:MAG: AMP-binding protein [Oscillospiraceae bacterium]|nr:AMP-binding protein [Oscillospiraceae bacterium]MDD4367736.1 AMP-binding protein [Oscillospiraceae bacterium]
MQIYSGKRLFQGEERYHSTLDLIRRSAKRYPNAPAYMFRRKPNSKVLIRSYSELLADVEALGTALQRHFPGRPNMALLGENCYEWAVSYNAVINGAGVIVPIDRMTPQGELLILLERSHSEVLILTPRHLSLAEAALSAVTSLKTIIVLDPVSAYRSAVKMPADSRYIRYTDLLTEGEEAIALGCQDYTGLVPDPDILSTIIFTSGTTDQAKGVMLSLNNLCANVYNISGALRLFPGERALSVLPLHHTFETTAGMLVMYYYGVCICFNDGLRYFPNNLVEWKINVMIGVPLLFENVYKRVNDSIDKSGMTNLVKVMRPFARGLAAVGLQTNRTLFKSVLDGLGGSLRLVVIGAAAMDKHIHQAFIDFGILFLQGYGLTESSPVVAVGTEKLNVPGTIGPPLPGVEVAIDTRGTDGNTVGELLTRSESVMLGYYENAAATHAAIDADGWLHTGDMGFVDSRGCIHITGRSKSMIVLTNGKKAFPEEIEAKLNKIAGVKESYAWGQRNKRDAVDICVKIQLNRAALPLADPQDNAAVAAYLKAAISKINASMPGYKAVRYFIFTEDDFIKTTTLKIKRKEEEKKLSAWLSAQGVYMHDIDGQFVHIP